MLRPDRDTIKRGRNRAGTRLAAMEIEGHPTQDLIEELRRRGALQLDGSAAGPQAEALRFLADRLVDEEGFWLCLPRAAVFKGFEDFSA